MTSTTSSLLPLLESLEDSSVGQTEQTDAYLTITSRLSGEDGRNFLPAVIKHFPRLGKVLQTHISSQNTELSQAALQALGFCVFHSNVVSGIPDNISEEFLVSLTSLVVNVKDKNTCTRALWVISKQNFPVEVVAKKVPDILKSLEVVQAREDIQSVIIGHEALNVVIRLLEQAPVQMGEAAVQWAKLVIPLVVHSASKVRLRAAAALEMGLPLLLKKQQEVAAIIEPLMSSKLIPELQKLFSSKNESNVLKLWPLFVRLLGKLLHRGGPFINSLLHLEELGFRSSSPVIKKIAFIAWKSLIDNFALNAEILCSTKRLKLLMQPLSSIQVRTEALLLTKLEVWWYLVVKLGPNLATNFEQVGIPLLQSAINAESQSQTPTPARNTSQNTSVVSCTPKAGNLTLNSPCSTPRMNLNSSVNGQQPFTSIQLLGLEMLLHYCMGPAVTDAAAQHKLQLSLEPLICPLLASPSTFNKFSSVLIGAVRDGFITAGKDASDALLVLIWNNLIGLVVAAVETAGNKKERQGSEVLTLLLQTLQSVVSSESLPTNHTLALLEATVNRLPCKILGSAAYQVANMDVLNGTPALFLFDLFFNSCFLPSFVLDERFFACLEFLVSCGLSGPTSSLAFSESLLRIIGRAADVVRDKEHLWRMWSIVVDPLTDTIMLTNEVNQGDALEHNFTAVYSALMFPLSHLLPGQALPQMTQKSLLGTWSRTYTAFARCSALVATAEENACCEELCCKIVAALDQQALANLSTLDAVANILLVIIECVDFSPYTAKFQQKTKSPRTPLNWGRKKNKALGNLASFQTLLLLSLDSLLSQGASETVESSGASACAAASLLFAALSVLFNNLAVSSAIREVVSSFSAPLAAFFEQTGRPQNEQPDFFSSVAPKLEKLIGEMLACLQSRTVMAYDSELLVLLVPLLRVLLPHKSKQIRTLVTQFWNATFGKAPVLNYPEELKLILSQVKQNTMIILPGFQAVDLNDDFSGQYSGECSQLETKISGVGVTPSGKRDSLLARAGELRPKTPSKPLLGKLDFGSPKHPRQELLEEEASLDFVFIPPEPKERVLTEHQKEVMRTKRTDIPAMYNNLDASLDTTLFSQYSQSQDDLMNKLSADDKAADTPVNEAQQEKMDTEELAQEAVKLKSKSAEEGACNEDPSAEEGDISRQSNLEGSTNDCDVSGSPDVVSGTPQKPPSRRQSFITLEKYEEGKTASPIANTKFTGSLSRTTEDQVSNAPPLNTETMQDPTVKETSQMSSGPNDSRPENEDQQAESADEADPVVKNSGQDTEDDEGVIPNTQVDAEADVPLAESMECTPLEEHPNDAMDSSENFRNTPDSVEIRRSGRRRSKPARPGEGAAVADEKNKLGKASTKELLTNRANVQRTPATQPEILSQGRSSRRSKNAVEQLALEDKVSSRTRTEHAKTRQSSQGRPSRKCRVSDGEVLEDKDQTSDRSAEEETKNSEKSGQKAQLLVAEAEVLSQSKVSKVPTLLNKDHDSQNVDLVGSQNVSSADSSPSLVVGSSQGKRTRKLTTEADSEVSSAPPYEGLNENKALQIGDKQENSQEPSQGFARYRTRRSSQGLQVNVENSESDASETCDNSHTSKKRRRKPNLSSPALTSSQPKNEAEQPEGGEQVESQLPTKMESSELAQETESKAAISETVEPAETKEAEEVLQDDVKLLESVDSDVSVKCPLETNAEVAKSMIVVLERTENKGTRSAVQDGSATPLEGTSKSDFVHVCPHTKRGRGRRRGRSCHCKTRGPLPQDIDSRDSQNTECLRESAASDPDSVEFQPADSPVHVGDSSTDDAVFESCTLSTPSVASSTIEMHSDISVCKGDDQETLGVEDTIVEGANGLEVNVEECQTDNICDPEEIVPLKESVEEHSTAPEEPQGLNGDESVAPLLEQSNPTLEEVEGTHANNEDVAVVAACATLPDKPSAVPQALVCVDSPPKQKYLDPVSGLVEVGDSPSSGKSRGVWSASASPSASILKKGQKRLLEEESPSPLPKSRRVSFADPIYHQELADDIDRRSPVIRSSGSNSPRSKNSAITVQPKYIITPTKGIQTRNLRSPGYKSSKKCLMSEMSQEPKPIPKDCVFPALVGCSVPVEAILPQLTSNMWPRGFGQLVRARNIKTVGDLSALTPSEIKSLPIRSPKLSNVKKALKIYHEQQRKGCDDLKAFDEMESMTSELEETDAPQDKVSLKVIETELSVIPLAAEQKSTDLPLAVKELASRLTLEELDHCSPEHLVVMHEQLSGMMRSIVVQLQSRLPCGTNNG
ncbi:telomere-associated protein RIF1 [Brienomyrus brachyistius]|uniref:telomere-associated protein RIF1 n=1 Tax=Brienomyrus brachyistius TaxID=42636 RepID=UPI0020B17A02|nr:telomere-associated protein RIF1 [Brienomyrus brachyistius]